MIIHSGEPDDRSAMPPISELLLWTNWLGRQAVAYERYGLLEILHIPSLFLFHIRQWLSESPEQEKFQSHEDSRTLPHKAY